MGHRYDVHGLTRSLLPCLALALSRIACAMTSSTDAQIELQLSPRICTLSSQDKKCDTKVEARWSAPRDESLCLIILQRPDVRRCWEHYAAGMYSLELTFADDLTFQLRDPGLENVLASQVLRVIREALHYRSRRPQPWNIFD
jgi:hypothetical protein